MLTAGVAVANASTVERHALSVPKQGKTGFTQLPSRSVGIHFTPTPENARIPSPYHVKNPGLAAGDVDGDGRCDLFICRLNGPASLYRNLGGWKFEDATQASGLAAVTNGFYGASFSDVDGDGDLDLVAVSLSGQSALLMNDGKGHFTENAKMPWRRTNSGGDTSLALADIDGDGDLDLYVASYAQNTLKSQMPPQQFREMVESERQRLKAGVRPTQYFLQHFLVLTMWNGNEATYQIEERGVQDMLYVNDGKGNFTPITEADGRFFDEDGKPMTLPADWGLAATFRDVDGDGDPDLYVCNDFLTPDRFWINDGNGRFHAISKLALRRTTRFSMGVDFADINRDGHLDFFSVDMLSRDHTRRKTQMGEMQPTPIVLGMIDDRPQIMQNTLQLNRGDGTFAELAQFAGIKASEWSWSPIFLDVDLDGYEDLLVTTGMERDYMDSDTIKRVEQMGPLTPAQRREMDKLYPNLNTGNFIFRNKGNLQFEDVSSQWGFRTAAVSGGMALADLDNDGDLDAVINNTDIEPEVYRNDTIAPRVAVRLRGRASNTQGIGARIKLVGGPVEQTTEVIAGGVYASGCDSLRVFAAGKGPMRLEVAWRDGKKSVVTDVKPDELYVIDESGAQPAPLQPTRGARPLFVDESARLNHKHTEAPFDDFVRQSLLPNRLSQLGPGLAWFDVDNDGDEDLIVASGRGGNLAVMVNDGKGSFARHDSPQVLIDQTTVLGWARPDGKRSLVVGLSNFESGDGELPAAQGFEFSRDSRWNLESGLPGHTSSTGPMSLGDVDGDGDLDLFVGGRTVPGKYPEPAGSRLYRNDNGKWQLAQEWPQMGLVSGSVLGDLDGDGDMDLVLACEWGPVRVFRNDRGQFSEATRELGLSGYTGWWNGVTLGDLDGDGRLDIVASNWGRNSKYEHAYNVLEPLKIYYGDFDGNGSVDIVEAHFDKRMGKLVPERGLSCSSRAMPFIRERTPTYLAFGSCGLEEIYGDKLKGARVVEANTLEHMVFLNRGKSFQAQPLPVQAQLAPGFGVNVGDYDGDGVEDVFLSQNFFAVQIETPR
ncbi:MAG: VCBS repeat-containing protein, partial [Verrucomicrobiota bacterium]